MCIAAEERTTTSVDSEVLFVKEVDSQVCLVTWPKGTSDVSEILKLFAHSVAVVKYTDCFSAEELDPPNESHGYDTK